MHPRQLRYEVMRDLYQSQRDRRERIRGNVGTPVAAFAFSVYALGMLAQTLHAADLADPLGLAAAALGAGAVLCLLIGAALIIRVERNIVYTDPPDLEELVASEKRLEEINGGDHAATAAQLQDLLTGAYDIVYRRYFAANEQAARDRTRGLHFVLFALSLLVIAFVLLPFRGGGS